jgi:ATP-dependent DNA ligase
MASTHVHIADMRAAIADGTIPGKFLGDRTAFVFPTISSWTALGARFFWTIKVHLVRRAADQSDLTVAIADEMLSAPTKPFPAAAGYKGVITVESQQENGKVRDTTPTYVVAGKNLGKANATNELTQALRDAVGLYNKQLKRADASDAPSQGSVRQAEAPAAAAAADEETESLEMKTPENVRPPPMLVKKLGDSREATLGAADYRAGVSMQYKFNGVRLVAYLEAAGVSARAPHAESSAAVLYSRTGGTYTGLDHWRVPVRDLLLLAPSLKVGEYGLTSAAAAAAYAEADGAPPAVYLDGECYLHGKPLNWISGQARKSGDEGTLEYCVFDCFFPHAIERGQQMSYRDRAAYLAALFRAGEEAGVDMRCLREIAPTKARNEAELQAFARAALAAGYEGAIARKDTKEYRYSYHNYHSANLLKIKPILDAEFEVVGFTQGSKGKDVGAIIWTCQVAEADAKIASDREFNVVPKDMSLPMRKAWYACMSAQVADVPATTRFARDVKGLMLTVIYPELSVKTGKPSQAKAVAFRTYEDGLEHDKIRAIQLECEASLRNGAPAPSARVPTVKMPGSIVRAAAAAPAAKEPAAKVPAAKVPAARVPAARVPAARVPAARVPAARVPAARVPAARVPAAAE